MARTRARRADNTWPGFVDALATLLLVIIFLLVVFMLAHFFLSQALTGRDEALQRLNARIEELANTLAMERQAAEEMRGSVAQLSASLQLSNQERDELSLRLREAEDRAAAAQAGLAEADRAVEVSRQTITARLAEIERLNRDIAALREVRDVLEDEVAVLAVALDDAGAEVDRLNAERDDAVLEGERRRAALDAALAQLGALRDRRAELEARLNDEAERTLLAQRELEEREIRLAEVEALYNQNAADLEAANVALAANNDELAESMRLSASALAQVTLLNQQIGALRQQLAALQEALDAADAKDVEQQVIIENLGARLNVALAQRVEELSAYRSEFFGRLRAVLGDRDDIRVVGDRFVFQSEVLFAVGQDEIAGEGQVQLAALARTLLEIAPEIPEEINWVLRVDGHTDIQPISTPRFPSNWELSTARAVSVVKFLVAQGIPETRLAATGFGQFQPLDDRPVPEAFQRNRRIELKLTER